MGEGFPLFMTDAVTKLKDLVNAELPLNRKEKFFTGTIFPMLVCRDNFKYFNMFTSLINGCAELKISAISPNIQFFTEYSLLESIVTKADKNRFPSLPRTKDTPDIIVLFNGIPKTLISIEGKMYGVPDAYTLKTQMDNQQKHVNYLKERLNIAKVFQCALLPKKLAEQVSYEKDGLKYVLESEYQIITLEELYRRYKEVCPEHYFLNLLKLALDSYDNLVSRSWVSSNCELKVSGWDIYQKYKSGTFNMKIMGRDKGLNGDPLKRDIAAGKWKTQQYETSSKDSFPSDNWFSVEEFVKQIDNTSS